MQNWFTSAEVLDLTSLHRLAQSAPCAFFYCPEYLFQPAKAGELDCLHLVAQVCVERGYRPVLLNDPRAWVDDLLTAEHHLHILMKDEPRKPAKNVFYCVPSYLNGYWYFDTKGVRNNSSTADAVFDADIIDAGRADKFHANLTAQFIDQNLSKFPQSNEPSTLPDDALFVPTQPFQKIDYCPSYIDYPVLISSLIGIRGNRPVVIKPHPLQSVDELRILAQFDDPNNRVHLVDNSIHQILAVSDLVITQSSAVAFEALIHKVPSVLAGSSDFHHLMPTINSVPQLGLAIETALNSTLPFEKYLFWFLREQMIKPAQTNNALRRIRELLSEI